MPSETYLAHLEERTYPKGMGGTRSARVKVGDVIVLGTV